MLFDSKMVVREIIVVKKPRDDSLQDKPISFPALDNLHLDMMENKKKLKKNLPLVIVKPIAAPSGSAAKTVPKKAANYSAAIISGVAGAAAGITAEKVSRTPKREEKFTPAPADPSVRIKTKKPTTPEPEEEEGGEEENLLEELGEEGDENGEGEELELEEEGDPNGEHEEEELDSTTTAATPAATAEVDPDAEYDPYAGMSPEERESKEKEEYIWRFKILKKKYKARKDIADYNEHDDLSTMKQTYERTLREIQLEDNCESYRMYLIGGFMLMEFVSNNWMGVDLTGFTAHQMTLMNKYDRMLIELGEKSYNRWGSNLPVEIRLIGFIILQAGIFYLGKIIAEKGGGTMADIFKMFTGTSVPAATEEKEPADPEAPKKKMRGPSVKVADLRKKVES